MLIFPVRHHSPAAALHVARLIRERRPRAVLVEGPADADGLIPPLLDAETVPPVALYAYRTDLDPDTGNCPARAAHYPFCTYSPEYAALRVGAEVGATLRFCDVPAALSLAWAGESAQAAEHGVGLGAEDSAEPGYADFAARLATAAGFDTFDAFWEAVFEQEAGQASLDRFVADLTAFGARARAFAAAAGDDGRDRLRERHMAAVARQVIAAGVPAADVLLVCGAAHAAAIRELTEAMTEPPALPIGVPTTLTLIPYSYPRLSEQSGYGAGNRAPWFYQQVWEHGGDYATASRTALVALAHGLRQAGQVASLAQVIDADRLALHLATLRGKPAPGVDELTDAAVACFGQGRPEPVAAALRAILVGQELGRVTPQVGPTPLQADFYATAQRLRLPILDAPRQILVHLPVPEEQAQSVFLHRLDAAGIPYARELESGLGSGGRAAQGGALAGLGRAREKWELCWSPATDARLVEANAWGSTLAEVGERRLAHALAAATRIDDGVDVLLRLALCDLPATFPAALARCEALAADSGSFPALARAAFRLDGLLAYGVARRLPTERLAALAARLFARAAVQLPAAAVCADEAAAEVEQPLIALHDLVQRNRPTAAPDLFWRAVETVAGMALPNAHPGLRGLALTLLELGGRLSDGALARRLRLALGSDAAANARLVAGLFALHRGTLVRNRAVVGAVSEFLIGLEIERLIPLLPALRRTLGDLSPAERAYLTETLAALLGLAPAAARLGPVTDLQRARLREADAAVAAVLAEWSERYGIA